MTDTSLLSTPCSDSGICSSSPEISVSGADPSVVHLPPKYVLCVQALYSGSNRKKQSHWTTSPKRRVKDFFVFVDFVFVLFWFYSRCKTLPQEFGFVFFFSRNKML